MPRFSKDTRYTLGAKIDACLLEVIEQVLKASYAEKTDKFIALKTASYKLDTVKFFLQVAWEIETIGTKNYITLSEKFNEAGKMIGGWLKSTK